MVETIEIRKVANGFILVVTEAGEDEPKEYVYDTQRKLLSKLKPLLGDKSE